MGDYIVGYKKPPVHSRFKKGICPNPKGRGKRTALEAGKIFGDVMNTPIEINEKGKSKRISMRDATVRQWVNAAIRGSVPAAGLLLDALMNPKSQSRPDQLVIMTEKELASQIAQRKVPANIVVRKDLLNFRQ